MKNNLGITMIELVVVLVILIIIATVAVASSEDTLKEADIAEVYVEMTTMQKTINAIIVQKEMNSNLEIEKDKYYDEEFDVGRDTSVEYGDNVLTEADNWYIIYGATSSVTNEEVANAEKAIYDASNVRDTLGLEAINHTYIVNYETGEVELLRPLTIDNKLVRTYYEVRSVAE